MTAKQLRPDHSMYSSSITSSPTLRLSGDDLARVRVRSFVLRIELTCGSTLFTRAIAGAFAPSKRHMRIHPSGGCIDHDHAGLGSTFEVRGFTQVRSADPCGEAKFSVVGYLRRLF